MAVAFQEEHDSPDESHNLETGAYTCSVTLRCDWAYRNALATEMRSKTCWHNSGALATARSVSITPAPGQQRGSGSVAAYEHAIVTVQFSNESKDDKPRNPTDKGMSGFYSESIEPAMEYVSVPGAYFSKSDSENPMPEDLELIPGGERSLSFVRFDYVLTWYDVENPPWEDILDQSGTVNADILFAKNGQSFAKETLLYSPGRCNQARVQNIEDQTKWEIPLRFKYAPNRNANGVRLGWNSRFNPKTGAFEPIFDKDGNQVKDFPPGDVQAWLRLLGAQQFQLKPKPV